MANQASSPSNEEVLWKGTPSQWQNVGWLLSCLLVVPIPIWFWKWLSTKNHQIILTAQRLRIRSGVLSKENEDVELYRIKDWTLTEPFNQRVFGKGTVKVMSSDRTAPELDLRWISKPEEFVEKLRHAVEAIRDSKRVRELDMGMGDGADVALD